MSLKIVIDAGHGLYTAGKHCDKKIDPKQTREWSLNDRIADKLETLLKPYDCEVLRADDTSGKKDVSLSKRVKIANNFGADVYISVHHNAGIKLGSGGGTVVYHYGNAAQAEMLYNSVVSRTGLVGNRSKKVIKKAFYVLKKTKAKAYLIENGFMDSKSDTPKILTEDHADKTALGILDFLKTIGLKEKIETYNDGLYRVRKSWEDSNSQIGAYKILYNAKQKADKNPGYYVFDDKGVAVYPIAKTLDQLAKEVICGKWGNGSKRKTNITNAYESGVIAYDYATIQKRVNELLK